MKTARRAYRLLLLAYPRPFRRLFARDMTDLFADRWRVERQGRAAGYMGDKLVRIHG